MTVKTTVNCANFWSSLSLSCPLSLAIVWQSVDNWDTFLPVIRPPSIGFLVQSFLFPCSKIVSTFCFPPKFSSDLQSYFIILDNKSNTSMQLIDTILQFHTISSNVVMSVVVVLVVAICCNNFIVVLKSLLYFKQGSYDLVLEIAISIYRCHLVIIFLQCFVWFLCFSYLQMHSTIGNWYLCKYL